MRRHHDDRRAGVDRLAADWFAASHARLGISRQSWYHPAVEEVVEAVRDGRPMGESLSRLAAARGGAGLDLAETLGDLEQLLALVPDDRRAELDRLSTASCLAAWSDAFIGRRHEPSCTDPLTGLATVDFLRTRIDEAYRHCAELGLDPDAAYSIVVVRPGRTSASPFLRMTERIRIARVLRSRFPGGETIAMQEDGVAFVLTASGPELTRRVDDVVAALDDARGPARRVSASVVQMPEDIRTIDDHLDLSYS